ncbi:hypothetical protein ACVW00_003781 [Marmoricola sp. URHA0025 HA25]
MILGGKGETKTSPAEPEVEEPPAPSLPKPRSATPAE